VSPGSARVAFGRTIHEPAKAEEPKAAVKRKPRGRDHHTLWQQFWHAWKQDGWICKFTTVAPGGSLMPSQQ
jgi:hypothetical protein